MILSTHNQFSDFTKLAITLSYNSLTAAIWLIGQILRLQTELFFHRTLPMMRRKCLASLELIQRMDYMIVPEKYFAI